MTNLTLVIDDKLLQVARIKALQEGTSVNEICREAIARYAQPASDGDEFMAKWMALAERIKPSTDREPIWPGREALYEEMLAHRLHGRLTERSQAQPQPQPQPKESERKPK